jgi:ABC-type transport system substrate-binding protein
VAGKIAIAALDPKTIDPTKVTEASGLLVVKQICQPLVEADPITGATRPGAAESWDVSEDAKKFTFHLRPGVKFHNGREVVAEDYIYSMSVFASNKEKDSRSFLLDRIAGYKDLRDGKATGLAGLKAPNPQTLEVETAEPFAELPAVLSHAAAGSAVPKEEVDKGADFAAKPVCTGPYMLAEPRQPGTNFRLVRFPDYVPEVSVFTRGGAGYADEIEFVIVPNMAEGYNRLLENVVIATPLSPDMLVKARRVRGRLESRSNGIFSYLGFPVTKKPFDNSLLRRALALSVDRTQIIEGLLAGSRAMPEGFLPESAGPAAKDAACPDTVKASSDLKEAKTALEVSKVVAADTHPKINYNDGAAGHESWLAMVADQWKSGLAIESTLAPTPDPEGLAKYLDFLVAGADGPFRLAWPVEYPSPEALFGPVFLGDSLDNYTRYKSAEFDDLVKKARATVDDKARRALYIQASKILCKELPAVPMWFGESHYAFHSTSASAKEQRLDLFGFPILRELGTRRR